MKQDSRIVELIDETIKFLRKHKWGQGFSYSRRGTYCVMEALAEASIIRGFDSDFLFSAEREIDKHLINEHAAIGGMTAWNDEDGRTKRQVIEELKEIKEVMGATS